MKRKRKRPKLRDFIIPCKKLPKRDKDGNYIVRVQLNELVNMSKFKPRAMVVMTQKGRRE